MAIIRNILVSIVALYVSTTLLYAQLPTRSEIDKAVNPTLSAVAKRGVCAQKSTIDIGEVEREELQEVNFKLRNTTAATVAITQLRSTCSCLKVATLPRALKPNEELEVVATFNPAGRSGKIKLDIFVYTSLDAQSPTERLTVTGVMNIGDKYSHLPYGMGELRLSRRSVTIDNCKVGATRTERIAVANAGTRELTISAQSTVEGLSLRLEPTTLMPGEEGDIMISYTTKQAVTQDIQTMLIVDGCSGRPTDRAIKVTITK